MIRVFRTRSGLKKTVKKVSLVENREPIGMTTDVALIPFSNNSLLLALMISKGIYESAGVNAGIVNIKIFIKRSKKDLILAANEGLCEIFKYESGIEDNCSISVTVYDYSCNDLLGNLFSRFDFIVFFLAIGATVRLIAPYIKDKLTDPGIVVIDELGKFAISLLSGHIGGGNEFTKKVANFLDATPIITTATDVLERFSIDVFAKRFDFFIEEPKKKIKSFNKASLNGERFVVYVNDAELNFKNYLRELKPYIASYLKEEDFIFITCASKFKEYRDKHTSNFKGQGSVASSGSDDLYKFNLIVISRLLNLEELRGLIGVNCAILRPKDLVIGIGCNRNTDSNEIDEFISSIFYKYNLSLNSVRNIATIDIKSDENGILQCLKDYARFIDFYTKEEINLFMEEHSGIKGDTLVIFKKTAAYKHTGAYSVCEPCALLSANNSEFLICKKKKGNVTMAVAVV